MKSRILILLSIFSLALTSCEDILDRQPMDTLSEANFWATPDNALSGLVGCYDALQSPNRDASALFDMWGARDVFTPIGMSRNGEYNTIAVGSADPTATLFRNTWELLYRGVVRCNDLLDNIYRIDFSGDSVLQNQIYGEALFLRALFYYGLVDHYGDVPLILHVQSISESQVSRDPMEVVIDSMLMDLELAIAGLPVSYSGNNVGRATKGAALALDVNYRMLIGDWEGAAESAGQVLQLGYSLQNNFADIFRLDNENNSEVIFDIQFLDGNVGEGNNFDKFFNNRSTQTNGWSRHNPTTYLVDYYEVIDNDPTFTVEDKIDSTVYQYFEGRDPRLDWTIIRPGSYLVDKNSDSIYYPYEVTAYSMSMTGMVLRKNILEGVEGTSFDSPNNWILFRLADLMLNYAEAQTEATVADGAMVNDPKIYDMVNSIRERASQDLPTYTAGSFSKEEMLEKIYEERIRELAFEGWLYTDFRRWGWIEQNDGFEVYGMSINSARTVLGTSPLQTRTYQPYMDLWAIPQSEREVNPNLTQNDGYPE